MKIKDGVIMSDQLVMRPVLIQAARIWQLHGQELVVTSGKDSVHSAGSLHYYGYAYDLRTRYFNKQTQVEVTTLLRQELDKISPQYRVILENTHIHVEWRGYIQ